MADPDIPSRSLQESVLSLICFNDKEGRIAVGVLTDKHFEEPYKTIAERVIQYHHRYGAAPGVAHIDDVFDDLLEDKESRQASTYRRLLIGLSEQAKHLNAEYVLGRITTFIKRQVMKGAIVQAAMEFQQGNPTAEEDAEKILMSAMRAHIDTFDPGVSLADGKRALQFLDAPADAIKLGIKELDMRDLGPTRKEMHLFLAPRKRGKSWWLIHVGKQAFLQRYNVCHISLEMSEERVVQRYYQQLFSIAKRPDEYHQTHMEFDELGRLSGFQISKVQPRLNLRDPKIRSYLMERLDQWGMRLDRIRIKQFATKSLTIAQLESYLDMLEITQKFIPDVLVVDYPDLMYFDPKNPRQALGRLYEELRGLAVRRNLALAAATQANRAGDDAKLVTDTNVSEDISKIATADIVITYSQTIDERRLGLARLFVSNARNDEDKFTVLITQSYRTGQFVLESAFMSGASYWKQLELQLGQLKELPVGEE